MATAKEVAEWMASHLQEKGYLEQEWAFWQIRKKFGEEFGYMNKNGGWSISRTVLREFKKLTTGTAVWNRSDKGWRRVGDKEKYRGRVEGQ